VKQCIEKAVGKLSSLKLNAADIKGKAKITECCHVYNNNNMVCGPLGSKTCFIFMCCVNFGLVFCAVLLSQVIVTSTLVQS